MKNLSRLIISEEIELAMEKLPTNESLGEDDFIAEFYQILKEKLLSISHKIFQSSK